MEVDGNFVGWQRVYGYRMMYVYDILTKIDKFLVLIFVLLHVHLPYYIGHKFGGYLVE